MVRGIFIYIYIYTLDLFSKRGRWKGEEEIGDGVGRGLRGDVSSYVSQVDLVSSYVSRVDPMYEMYSIKQLQIMSWHI